jgi:hypothetical protein
MSSTYQGLQSNIVTPLGDSPNSPMLNDDMQQHVPAITDIGQALQLVRSLQAENREREKKNARILERYNAERPYNPHQLKADGLAWKTNFTTKPLTTLIDKVVPRFTSAIRGMKYLTASALPDNVLDASAKSEFFQRKITEACRAHEQWDQFINDIAQENTLFGYVCAAWLDSYSWFPRYYDQDSFLVPQGTKHNAKSACVVCVRDSYLVHQLFDMVRDFNAADVAGWNVPNVVEAINNAIPDDRRSYQTDYSRVYADLVRESAILSSFTGAKSVICWHVFVTEVDGYVTHVAFDDRSGKQLFWANKQFERMSDAASFFTFQHGNGRIHGSKGIGRELYNMASVLDRARNEVVDRLQLSGKLILQCDEKEIKRFRMSVVGNAILIASGYQVRESKIDGNVEAFFALDKFLTQLLDQIGGSVSPNTTPEGERVTKAQVELNAAREQEKSDAVIERFLQHFARFMTTIQRRLCDPQTIDKDAKELQESLLKVLSREELDYLAKQPAVSAIADYTDKERQQIALIAQEGRGNPLYNQYALEKASLIAKIGRDFAEEVLLPQNDPTEVAENEREQLMENDAMKSGVPLPVSPRDNHVIHLEVIQQTINSLVQQAVNNAPVWHFMEILAAHGSDHVKIGEQRGMQKAMQPYKIFLTKVASTLIKLHQTQPGFPGGPPAAKALGIEQPNPNTPSPSASGAPAKTPVHEAINISYKDLPEDVKREVEALVGLTPSKITPNAQPPKSA